MKGREKEIIAQQCVKCAVFFPQEINKHRQASVYQTLPLCFKEKSNSGCSGYGLFQFHFTPGCEHPIHFEEHCLCPLHRLTGDETEVQKGDSSVTE